MGKKKCDLTQELMEQLNIDNLSEKMKDHIKSCSECSNEYLINTWMKGYGDTGTSDLNSDIPPFDSLWSRSFREKRVEPDLIEQAMRPMKIAGLFAKLSAILLIILFLIFNKNVIFGVEDQLENISRLGMSFITPFIKMFNSSVYVSIPLTIVFASIFLYLIFSIFNSLNKRSYGNV